jgi:branched-chain amino acid transport system ATP-binding protein
MTAESTVLLEARNITKRFAGVAALNDVSIDIHDHEILAVVGPNGSGKTTMFGVLSGFLRPTVGTVSLEGRRIDGLSPDRVNRMGLSRTFQQAMAFNSLTVRENLALAQLAIGEDSDRQDELLQLCGLTDVASAPSAGLPYGLLRKLGVAVGLATRPKLMLLDEPAAGLSEGDSESLAELIAVLPSEGVSVACIDHNLPFLFPIADRVVVLDAGIKIFDGTPTEARDSAAVVEAYLGVSNG